ncbi:Trp biosynthesis-associated membrane protein [Salinibacterium sp. G-O1]|uniref:Trp biosynthesis-associated membrane protein n=1 Tax=Salinibacterium sp. G-O1 TaxID=3046208 RepID=UPI0024B97787|nr:Trp biosynthesis-associated membrane protein [Salinibacterium sp. G-O1]MDJ0335165.1 Trp biosynthesis-associated membrane protein [Salinibacterium sp. G-O1]
MTSARLKLLLIVAGAALGALTLLSWTQVWFTLTLDGGQPLEVAGQAAAPGLSALGLACLALAGALAIAGKVLRIVLGVLETLIGIAVLVAAISAITAPIAASTSTITAATAVSGSQSVAAIVVTITATGWPWLALVAGILIAVLGVAVVALSPRWPGPTRKYESTEAGADDDTTTPIGAWDSLSGGSDPTTR